MRSISWRRLSREPVRHGRRTGISVGGSNGRLALTNAQASVGGGADPVFLVGGGSTASLSDTGGDWDFVGGSNGMVALTNAQASVVGGADAVYLVGGGSTVSLSDTGGDWDL